MATGCALCRARKIKCDERQPKCLNCERLGFDCPGPGPGSRFRRRLDAISVPGGHREQLTEAGTQRRRISRSCTECRSAKTKCSGAKPACARCLMKGTCCIYSPKNHSRSESPMGQQPKAETPFRPSSPCSSIELKIRSLTERKESSPVTQLVEFESEDCLSWYDGGRRQS